jgi:hypothetical protein
MQKPEIVITAKNIIDTPNIKANLNFSILRTQVIGPKLKRRNSATNILLSIWKLEEIASITNDNCEIVN